MPAAGYTGGFFYAPAVVLAPLRDIGASPPFVPAKRRLSKRNFLETLYLYDNQLNIHSPVLSNINNMKKHGTL